MTEAAGTLLAVLDDAQRAKATFPLDDAERRNWAYFPSDFHGLPLGEMTPKQQKLTHTLVSSALSLPAYARVTSIIALDNVLDIMEDRRISAVRDPARYFVSIFGAPGNDAPWGWRFEGHHVSLHFTIADGALVSPTPLFLGANPSEVMDGDHAVLRPCGQEEDLGRELLLSLDADRRRIATICDIAPPDIVLMNLPAVPDVRDFELTPSLGAVGRGMLRVEGMEEATKEAVRFDRAKPAGLAASAMDANQRALLSGVVDLYVGRLPDDLRAIERAKIDAAGIDAVHFAWAGSDRRREGHYYRLQSPAFIVEYDNTQDGANHIHAVWRHPTADFGADLLRDHLRIAH
jgi:hypothetical protein